MLLMTYYGHSAFAINNTKRKLLFDPFLTGNPLATTTPDVVTCNYILISHGHADHMGDAGAIANRTGATVIGVPEIVEASGAKLGHGMNIGGKVDFDFGSVYMTQAFHSAGVAGAEAAGFVVTINGKNIYYAGDTSVFGDMGYIGFKFDIDVAILPIGDNYTMGIDDAVEAVKLLGAKHVIPVHYNTWPVIAADPVLFQDRVETETDARVHIMNPGDAIDLDLL